MPILCVLGADFRRESTCSAVEQRPVSSAFVFASVFFAPVVSVPAVSAPVVSAPVVSAPGLNCRLGARRRRAYSSGRVPGEAGQVYCRPDGRARRVSSTQVLIVA